jgi:hypothetical protein
MIIDMKRRRFRFSLLGLFLFITVIAAGLGWWYSRPLRIVGDGSGTYYKFISQAPDVSPRTAASYARHTWTVVTPRVERRVKCTLVVIAPSPLGGRFISGERLGQVGWQRNIGTEIWVWEMPDFDKSLRTYPSLKPPGFLGDCPAVYQAVLAADLKLIYDASENTVTLGNQTFPASEDSTYVVHVDNKWQARLIVADAQLNIPHVPADVLDELRKLHQSMLQIP